jgi:hypothetical protein
MRRALLGLAIAAVACSGLPTTGDSVVALEIVEPASLTLDAHGTLMLHARALNLQGDSVAADIRWITPDTALVGLDTVTGLVTAISDTGGRARVQASLGNLRSDVVLITLQPDTTTAGLRAAP